MSLELFVKTINNESHRFEVSVALLVGELKHLVQNTTQVSIDRQRLIYRGQVLQDENSLQHYNIETGHTVHMVARPLNATRSPSQADRSSQDNVEQENIASIQLPSADPLMALLGPLGGSGGINDLLQGARRNTEPAVPPRNPQSLEHIRQSVLTIHSLQASMPPTVFVPLGFEAGPNVAESDEDNGQALTRAFYVGQWIDVKDTVNQWLEATVMQVNTIEKKIFVHYNGWPTHWDEWIESDSPRISPFRTRTIHAGNSSLQCPTPNTTVSFAPVTGRDDIRRILPALLGTYESLGAMLRQAATLATQSIAEEPTLYDNTLATGGGIAAGMPWDSLVPELPHNEQPSAQSDSAPGRNPTQQLAELTQLMLPLMDRFGRVLTDVAPHLNIEYDPNSSNNVDSPDNVGHLANAMPAEPRSLADLADEYRDITSPSFAQSSQQSQPPQETLSPDNGLAAFLAASLPPSLRQLLQPRPPSPPPQRAYRQLINSPLNRGNSGINHLVDIHIHAILTPSRPTAPHVQPISLSQSITHQATPTGNNSSRNATERTAANDPSPVTMNMPAAEETTNILHNTSAASTNSYLRDDNFSSNDDDSEDDDDSIENENDKDDDADKETLSGAVSAVSTLLASFGRENSSSSVQALAGAEVSIQQRDAENSTFSEALVGCSSEKAISGPVKSSPKNDIQHSSRRRLENDDSSRLRYGDLSERERSTAHDLVEKYRSRERERRNWHAVPRLLNDSVSMSPQSSPRRGTTAMASSSFTDKASTNGAEFMPEKIKPLTSPPNGLFAGGGRRDEHLTESLVAQSLERQERLEMESNVLAVQRTFDLGRKGPRLDETTAPLPTCGDKSSAGVVKGRFSMRKEISLETAVSKSSSQDTNVNVVSSSSEAHSRSSAAREDVPPQRRPSLISRLKKAVSFTDRNSTDNLHKRNK